MNSHEPQTIQRKGRPRKDGSKSRSRAQKPREGPFILNKEETSRFWSKVNKNGPAPEHRPELGKCWVWLGAPAVSGYGMMGLWGYQIGAHRISFQIHHHTLEKGFCALHKCDNRVCVNPSHLFAGTATDNMRDMCEKGRNYIPPKGVNPFPVLRGEEARSAKLTEEKVREIRIRHSQGESYPKLGAEYGVHNSVIYQIYHRLIWRHVA